MAGTLGEVSVTLLMNVQQFLTGSKTATTTMQGLEKQGTLTSKNLSSSFGSLFKMVGGGLLAFGILKRGVADSVAEFYKAKDSVDRLTAALDGDFKKAQEIQNLAGSFQKFTIFGDETIQDQATFLAGNERTQEQIKKTLAAAVDFSSFSKRDLSTVIKDLNATYEGNIGKLGRIDSRLKELTPEQLKNGAAVDLIAEKYKGWGEIIGSTTEGKIKRFQNAMDELQEGIGSGFIESLAGDFDDLSESILGTTTNSKELGKYIGAGLLIVFKSLFGLVIPYFQDLMYILKSTKGIFRDLTETVGTFSLSLLDLPAKLPIVGNFFEQMKDKAQIYLNKLLEILGVQHAMVQGQALPEGKYDKDGNYIGTAKDPMLDPANNGTKNNTSNTGSKTQALKEEKAELDEVAKKQEELAKLQVKYNDAVEKKYIGLAKNYAAEIKQLKIEIEELIKGTEKLSAVENTRYEHAQSTRQGLEPGKSDPSKPRDVIDEESWMKNWTFALNVAEQIDSLINKRPKNLLDGLAEALKIAATIAVMSGAGPLGGFLGAIGGIFGLFGGLFDSGGYTGDGGKYQYAGAVHKGEVVFDQPAVKNLGVGFLESLRLLAGGSRSKSSGGFYNGGAALNSMMSGGGTIYITNTGEFSEGLSTKVVRKGMSGYKIIMSKKGQH